MKIFVRLFLFAFLFIPQKGQSQQKDSVIHKLDSLSEKTDSAGGQFNNINSGAYNQSTRLTFHTYFALLGSDLKQAFAKPFHMKGKDWWRLGEFALVTGAVMFVDEPIQKFALRTTTNSSGIKNISNDITTFGGVGEVVTLSALGTYGVIFKKHKIVTTTLLATQAYITAGVIEGVTKYLTGRTRPSAYYNGAEAEPKFLGPFKNSPNDVNGNILYSSFPSGHASVVFAAATVFAMEYKDQPLIPIVAYSVATLVGLSRIAQNEHWASDIIAGAGLGYLSGRLIVNNYHRFAKVKAPNQNRNTVSFNLNYFQHTLMPGVIYKFR